MGLIKATVGSVGGSLADQWRDFFTVPSDVTPTLALFPAIQEGQNRGRGSDTKASRAIVTNGSKIIVPEGYGLLLFEDGELTAFTAEPGGYTWDSEDINSASVFTGGGVRGAMIKQSWERFKFGGRPGSQQIPIFVNIKELPNNKFGTTSEIYWDDAYFNAQVGVRTHGTYSLNIVDPVLFTKEVVPATYLQGIDPFDFTDRDNPVSSQLFSEVVGSLAAALSAYTNDDSKGHRITKIQQDSVGFAKSLSEAVEESYRWTAERGLSIFNVTILGIEYTPETQELLQTVQRADALAGNRGDVNLQASTAAGIQSAGENDGAGGVLGMGIAAGSIGLGGMMQQGREAAPAPEPGSTPTAQVANAGPDEKDVVTRLAEFKAALDADLISQEDYDNAKARILGLG